LRHSRLVRAVRLPKTPGAIVSYGWAPRYRGAVGRRGRHSTQCEEMPGMLVMPPLPVHTPSRLTPTPYAEEADATNTVSSGFARIEGATKPPLHGDSTASCTEEDNRYRVDPTGPTDTTTIYPNGATDPDGPTDPNGTFTFVNPPLNVQTHMREGTSVQGFMNLDDLQIDHARMRGSGGQLHAQTDTDDKDDTRNDINLYEQAGSVPNGFRAQALRANAGGSATEPGPGSTGYDRDVHSTCRRHQEGIFSGVHVPYSSDNEHGALANNDPMDSHEGGGTTFQRYATVMYSTLQQCATSQMNFKTIIMQGRVTTRASGDEGAWRRLLQVEVRCRGTVQGHDSWLRCPGLNDERVQGKARAGTCNRPALFGFLLTALQRRPPHPPTSTPALARHPPKTSDTGAWD